ncbi:MAG: radical SAM protein [Syntrophobacteraceae bacterium]
MSKTPQFLLINPWITDFAAYDLWTKPMGLLILASLLKNGGCQVSLVDCLDRQDPFTNAHFEILPGKDKLFGTGKYPRLRLPLPLPYSGIPRYFYRHGIHPESYRRKLHQAGKPDLIWVTSIMTYWYPGVQEAIRIAREEFPDVPIWLGGIYALLCPQHAAKHSGCDRVITNPVSELPGLVAAQTGFPIQNAEKWIDFSLWPPPALDLLPSIGYAPILTGIGCPYRCPYCASSILQRERRRLPSERIYDEIVHAHEVFGICDFAFYDDALLIDAGQTLRPALERIAAENRPLRFHSPNALHIRALSQDWCDLLHAAAFRTIRLGLETTTDARSREWGGKVDTQMFLRALENLFNAGFSGDEIGVYLLCGLPGQTPDEVAEAIAIVKGNGVRPHLAEYSPIPGTPMWEKAVALSSFNIEEEPLYHNNTFFACRNPDFTYEDMLTLKRLARR